MEKILVTGGAGYIGSHICLKLRESGYQPVVLDNLSNGHRDALANDIPFVRADIRDRAALDDTFKTFRPTAVIHMAALIEAGLSMEEPASFYEVNTAGSLNLLEAMRQHGCWQIVFSSTAAVYGNTNLEMLDETLPVRPENPYGRSKAMIETMLADFCSIYGFRAIALRYFNAAGADPAGRAGERHNPETHLIPLALSAAAGQRNGLKIFGSDYDTPDGTCIRDYVHVDDLAAAHIRALDYLIAQTNSFFDIVNIGTGKGCSVSDILLFCQEVTGSKFPISTTVRRPGDPARLIANPAKAKSLLNWTPRYADPREMISHAWSYYCDNSEKS
ncbi:UDP-glucose 4-epimerase GalE [Thalassospira sp. A3_1]|uniref:UDP-glucose 4-epimerase GalE n=1 Tax=Thalassospira sp. A3_1 TaxID=2821088 RepID=UPI001ADA2B29|nr:UDP-glucose 4-epimerase GalE [Thalassospira sp. A3_1]MBO9506804.1 UDP-glucose 4-epimerase GalE [Thalassospira sp. A3_1]